MGRGSKEGSSQKTQGERQQLSLREVLTTSVIDEEPEAQKKFHSKSTVLPTAQS